MWRLIMLNRITEEEPKTGKHEILICHKGNSTNIFQGAKWRNGKRGSLLLNRKQEPLEFEQKW